MQSYIKTLDNNKNTGPSNILNKLLKKAFVEPLTNLLNLKFCEGKFTAILDMGKTIPVHKNSCKIEVNNRGSVK